MSEPHSTPPAPESQPGPEPNEDPQAQRSFMDYLTDPSSRRIEWLAVCLIVAFGLFAIVATRGDLLAQAVPVPTTAETSAGPGQAGPTPDILDRPYRLTELELHPDQAYGRYFSGAFFTDGASGDDATTTRSAMEDFRTQLDIYRKRAGEDDNFTIRIYDNRTWQTLEVFTLREQRERFERTGEANWGHIDALRVQAQRQLTAKWTGRGIPNSAIAARWGRFNQIQEARERKAAFVEYEIRYARKLGLSLLATEIGTVETFNQDHLVSPVGARGRYQMMPDILDLFELRTFSLPAASGRVTIREELHPLLSLQASFLLVRGYSNSVGHEIPGVSAYHTGPGNIMHLYQTFLRANSNDPSIQDASVIQAYMWGVTSGFDRVRQQSSFGPHSRGYVLSAYGALRAMDEVPIDPDRTLRTERVQLASGSTIALANLLELLEPHGARLNWGAGVDHPNLYERFRALNPHFDLPAAGGTNVLTVPAAGNVTLSATSNAGSPVRVFLPYGATEALERLRPGLLNAELTFLFNENTFADPAVTGEKTQWDYEYDELIQDISQFGFSTANLNRVGALYRRFQQLAADDPSEYRQAQLKIVTIHRRVWLTARFRDLSGTAQNVLQARRAPADGVAAATTN